MSIKERVAAIKNQREREFVENFFDHEEWEYQPTALDFGGFTYRPDFLDKKRGVYIEVAGTRQALSQGRAKYVKAMETLPEGTFEIRNVQGEIISLRGFPVKPKYDLLAEIKESERRILVLFNRIMKKRSLTYEEIGLKVFPEDHDPAGHVRSLVGGVKRIGMVDFLKFCHAFEYCSDEIISYATRRPPEILYPEAIPYLSREFPELRGESFLDEPKLLEE